MNVIAYIPENDPAVRMTWPVTRPVYRDLFRRFLPLLQHIGKVLVVRDAAELAASLSHGERTFRIICYCLPHEIPVEMDGRFICLVAWPFESVPRELRADDSRTGWPDRLGRCGSVWVLSEHGRDMVHQLMGGTFPVDSIPPPLAPSMRKHGQLADTEIPLGRLTLAIKGRVLDSRSTHDPFGIAEQIKHGEIFLFSFRAEDERYARLMGFFMPESWGTWSAAKEPHVRFPFSFSGDVCLGIRAMGIDANIGRAITVRAGSQRAALTLEGALHDHAVCFHLDDPVNRIDFEGLDVRIRTGEEDTRSMALGLAAIECCRVAEEMPGSSFRTTFTSAAPKAALLDGFYDAEPWLTWSRTSQPSIILPFKLSGEVWLTMRLAGAWENIGRGIDVVVGEERHLITLSHRPRQHRIRLRLSTPCNRISFSGLLVLPRPGETDIRSIAMGIHSLEISRSPDRIKSWCLEASSLIQEAFRRLVDVRPGHSSKRPH